MRLNIIPNCNYLYHCSAHDSVFCEVNIKGVKDVNYVKYY